jgi:hypothetical protein
MDSVGRLYFGFSPGSKIVFLISKIFLPLFGRPPCLYKTGNVGWVSIVYKAVTFRHGLSFQLSRILLWHKILSDDL